MRAEEKKIWELNPSLGHVDECVSMWIWMCMDVYGCVGHRGILLSNDVDGDDNTCRAIFVTTAAVLTEHKAPIRPLTTSYQLEVHYLMLDVDVDVDWMWIGCGLDVDVDIDVNMGVDADVDVEADVDVDWIVDAGVDAGIDVDMDGIGSI
jgi:hypothetical protein